MFVRQSCRRDDLRIVSSDYWREVVIRQEKQPSLSQRTGMMIVRDVVVFLMMTMMRNYSRSRDDLLAMKI